VTLDDRAHSLAHDQVVVCQENVDGAFSRRGDVVHEYFLAHLGREGQ
jgi:hypothetical protein